MPFSAFARHANGFRFSSKKPAGKALYDSFRTSNGNGEAFAEGGPMAARWFAWAMAIARQQSTLERAANQADPLKCWDLLEAHERHYGISVPTGASLNERREALNTAQSLVLGPIRSNIEYQLSTALGDDFVAWLTTTATPFESVDGEQTYYPMMPWDLEEHASGPIPAPRGIFGQPSVWTRVSITSSIATLGSRTVPWANIGGDVVRLAVGDLIVVDPYAEGLRELVEITAQTASTFTAFFTKAHGADTEAIIWPFPFWLSRSKHSLVVVPNGRAMDPGVRQKANEVMRKIIGGTSTWDVVEESTTPGQLLGFIPGIGAPGITPIETRTF